MAQDALSRIDRKLIRAVEARDLEAVNKALEQGANPDAMKQYNSVLLIACLAEQADIARVLVRAGARGMDLVNTRDPMVEALRGGSLAMVAALLDVEATPHAVAGALRDPTHSKHQGTIYLCGWLLRPQNEATMAAFLEKDAGPYAAENWWKMAMRMHEPSRPSLRLVEERLGPPTANMLGWVEKELPGIEVLEAFERQGLLGADVLFSTEPGRNETAHFHGLMEAYAKRSYGKRVGWMIDKTHQTTHGRAYLRRAMPELMFPILGNKANLGLGKKLAARAGVGLQEAMQGANAQGQTFLHALLEQQDEPTKRLAIAKMALEAGVDPMQEDNENIPACLGALRFQRGAKEMFDLFHGNGVDWNTNTTPWDDLLRIKVKPMHLLAACLQRLDKHLSQANQAALQAHTPLTTARRTSRL